MLYLPYYTQPINQLLPIIGRQLWYGHRVQVLDCYELILPLPQPG